jgi:hypothetical protein
MSGEVGRTSSPCCIGGFHLAADFKSHVLRRDEKGFFGIPFKRLLLAGVIGGLAYTFSNIFLSLWAILFGIGIAILALIFTAMRGGLPLWQRLLFGMRGSLLLQAARQPKSLAGQLVRLLDLDVDVMRLQGNAVFAPPTGELDVDLREWITFAYAQETDGLIFVDSPLGGDAS